MLSFSQRVLGVLTFVIVLLGLAGIGVSIWLLVTSFNWSSIVNNFQSTMIIIFIVVSVLVLVTGILGLVGSCCGNTCCLGIFSVLIVLWLLLFLVAGILAFVFPKVVLDKGCMSTRMNVQKFYNLSQKADQTLCHANCQCYFQNPPLLSGLNTTSNANAPVKVTNCPGWYSTYEDSVLEQMEKQFKCSGWCSGSQGSYFKFTNVNNGVPTKSCYDAFNSWFRKYGRIIGGISFGIMGILFITSFVSGCAMTSIREEDIMRKQVYGGVPAYGTYTHR